MAMPTGGCNMFTIEMLPAAYGDCLWVEYGNRQSAAPYLIDGGISSTYNAIVRTPVRLVLPVLLS